MAEPEKPDEQDASVIVCGDGPHIEGSQQRECSGCGKAVYIAPSGQEIEKRTGAKLMCFECALTGMKKAKEEGEEVKIMPPQPEQKSEIVEELTRQFLRDVDKNDDPHKGWLKL